jgi:bifunctional NMN adenylyltransferase/nudix hydrolase
MKNKLAVIVGRFQSESVCNAMDEFIRKLANDNDKVLILLGLSTIVATKENRYDFETRKLMLGNTYSNVRFSNIEIGYVKDARDNEAWSANLDEQVDRFIKKHQGNGETDTTIYGGEHTMVRDYNGIFDVKPLPNEIYVNVEADGNQVPSIVKATIEFRKGVSWTVNNQYPHAYPTVDVAILDGTRLLMARKPNEDKYRFIGGFVDPTDESMEESAIREVKEESDIDIEHPIYVCSQLQKDWRYIRERDKIMTTLFFVEFKGGIPKPQDDIQELRFFELADFETQPIDTMIVPEHIELFNKLIKFIDKR